MRRARTRGLGLLDLVVVLALLALLVYVARLDWRHGDDRVAPPPAPAPAA